MAKKKRKTAEHSGSRSHEPDTNKLPLIESLEAMKQLKQSWPSDVESMLSAHMEQELWEMVVESASKVCDRYAWATPDARALKILSHFDPIIEIGAGAGYWAHCMHQRGIACDAYDMFDPSASSGTPRELWTAVRRGGPDVLKDPKNAHKTLLLCYPDDFEASDESMAAACLEALQADTVVHCGELFGDCPMIDKAPWGRTSGPDFQQHLFTMFRCVLKAPLPSWPHCNDFLTVWRRAATCVFHLPCEESGSGEAGDGAGVGESGRSGASGGSGAASEQDASGTQVDGTGRTTQPPKRNAAANDDAAPDGQGKTACTSGESADSEDDDDDDDAIEMVCDFQKFSLTTEQPANGWAIPPLQHLL